jgi:hypothetical protein
MPALRNGHAPGYVRDVAHEAFEAWLDWDGAAPEPKVEYEEGHEPRSIPISVACGLVWNCRDIVPGDLFDVLHDAFNYGERTLGSRTYAACARAILADIKDRRPSV